MDMVWVPSVTGVTWSDGSCRNDSLGGVEEYASVGFLVLWIGGTADNVSDGPRPVSGSAFKLAQGDVDASQGTSLDTLPSELVTQMLVPSNAACLGLPPVM